MEGGIKENVKKKSLFNLTFQLIKQVISGEMCICISIDEKTRRIALSLHPLNHKRILTVVELVLFVSKCMFLSNCVVLCVVCWDTSPRRLFFHF